MNWKNKDGDKYTKRNNVDYKLRIEYFYKNLPKNIKRVLELAPNKGHNMQAIQELGYKVYGIEINHKAVKEARKKGLSVIQGDILTTPWPKVDALLFSGILIHIHPIDLGYLFKKINDSRANYVLINEHISDTLTTINSKNYKNAFWVMDFGKEFIKRYPDWKITKKGWSCGKEPKIIDFMSGYTALLDKDEAFGPLDFTWTLERK